MKKIAIVGAGASGLFYALNLAKNTNFDITIFEQNSQIGKKILVSGNGRCNITNKRLALHNYYGDDIYLLKDIFKIFGYKQQKDYFESLGMLLHESEDGRVFPYSLEAKSVVEFFSFYLKKYNVKIELNKKITQIKKDLTLIDEKDKKYKFDVVVLAIGLKAATHLGGNDDIINIAKQLNLKTSKIFPSLVQLQSNYKYLKELSGIKIDSKVSLYINNKKEDEKKGDLLFTNYGLSGLVILDISTKASIALLEKKYVLIIADLLVDFENKKLSDFILKSSKVNGLNIFTCLNMLLPKKLVNIILKELKIEKTKIITNQKIIRQIVSKIKRFEFKINSTKDFRYAEVCGGGVKLSEVDINSFEVKKIKNLYIIGEALDVVGDRGGYNFAFCWSSAYLASKKLINSCEK